jgi:hypothetical protein
VNTADGVQIYRDGAVISAGSYSWPTTTSVDLTLANHRNDASVVYSLPSNVYFDEVGIWSRALDLCEVQQLYTEQQQFIITQQPGSQFQDVGSSTVFQVQTPGGNVSYQWQANSGFGFQNLSNAGQYQGVNTPTLTVTNINSSNNNQLFRCIVSNNGVCVDTSDEAALYIVPMGVTPVDKLHEVIVGPNPVADFVTIQYPGSSELNFDLSDAAGKRIIGGTVEGGMQRVALDHLPSDVYFLQVRAESGRRVFKLVKE